MQSQSLPGAALQGHQDQPVQPHAHPGEAVRSLLSQNSPHLAHTRQVSVHRQNKSPGICPASAPTQNLLPALLEAVKESCPGKAAYMARYHRDSLGPPVSSSNNTTAQSLSHFYLHNCTARFPMTLECGGSETLISHIHKLNISSGKEEKNSKSHYWVLQGHMQQLQLLATTIKTMKQSEAMAVQQHRARSHLPQPGTSGFHSCIFGSTVGFLAGTTGSFKSLLWERGVGVHILTYLPELDALEDKAPGRQPGLGRLNQIPRFLLQRECLGDTGFVRTG